MATTHVFPDRTEASDYYFTYINKVNSGNVLEILEGQAEEVPNWLMSISEGKSLHRYGPGKWSVREVLGHINDCERLFQARAFWFARGFDSPLPSFDQNVCIAAADSDKLPWIRHIEEFRAVRQSTLTFFRNLPESGWKMRGIASDNSFTVRALAFITAGHVIHHLDIVRTRYLGS